MTTANQIIRSALGKLGIVSPGESVTPNDAEDCLRSLNMLLDAWRVENLYAYTRQTLTQTLPAGTQTVSIGPSPGFDIYTASRPTRIEGGFVRVGSRDYPFRIVGDDEWNAVADKNVAGTAPEIATYRATLPNGTLFMFPLFAGVAEVLLDVQTQVTEFADLTTDYELPPGYEIALAYTLAEHVAADYGIKIPPTVQRQAANARRLLKRLNHQLPQLDVACVDAGSIPFHVLAGV